MAKNLEKWGRETAQARHGAGKPADTFDSAPEANDLQEPQDIQNEHEKNYDNDVRKGPNAWADGVGEPYPHFDKGPSGNRYKGK